jgi:hypothetical protein
VNQLGELTLTNMEHYFMLVCVEQIKIKKYQNNKREIV